MGEKKRNLVTPYTNILKYLSLVKANLIAFVKTVLCSIFQFCSQEVFRIRAEHPDDNQAIFNDRVKGQLKVTRAFGAGFLKRVS